MVFILFILQLIFSILAIKYSLRKNYISSYIYLAGTIVCIWTILSILGRLK